MIKNHILYSLIFVLLANTSCTKIENIVTSTNSIPTPPQNLNAIPGNKKVFLSWDSPSSNGGLSLIEYNIYRREASGSSILIKHNSPDSLSYLDSDTSLVNGNSYLYTVTAKNDLGESDRSNEINVVPTPDIYPPSPPQNLVGFSGFGSNLLQWKSPSYNGGSPIINYKIYRGTSENNISFYITLFDSNNIFVDNDITKSSTYYYQVSASNSLHESNRSNVNIVLNSNVPSLILPEDNSIETTITPKFLWSNVVNSTGYHLQVSLNPSFSTNELEVSGLINSQYTPPKFVLAENSLYYWRVKAYKNNDSSSWSVPYTFQISLDTINPTSKVLVELFTNTSNIPCVEANNYLDAIYNLNGITSNDANVVILRYHTTLFANDPFYLYNVTDNNARMTFYPNSAIVNPRAYLLGLFMGNFSSSTWTNKLNEKLAETRTYAIKLTNTYDSVSRNGSINIKIKQISGAVFNDLVYQVAVSENEIQYNAPNGETVFDNTFRDFITPPSGQPFTISPGQTNSYDHNYNIDNAINQDHADITVFVQRNNNTGKDVLAVEKIKLK